MRYFNKLPGFIKTPSGIEWVLLKKLPLIFGICAAIPTAAILFIYFGNQPVNPEQLKTIYMCLGVLFSICFFVGAAAIGCIVVILMKGPAYVADPYELPKENKKLEQHPNL
jgi:predicted membrane metal-binding protein